MLYPYQKKLKKEWKCFIITQTNLHAVTKASWRSKIQMPLHKTKATFGKSLSTGLCLSEVNLHCHCNLLNTIPGNACLVESQRTRHGWVLLNLVVPKGIHKTGQMIINFHLIIYKFNFSRKHLGKTKTKKIIQLLSSYANMAYQPLHALLINIVTVMRRLH